MAEGEGFEPPELAFNGFQDRRLKPLGHPSDLFLLFYSPADKCQATLSLAAFMVTFGQFWKGRGGMG